MQRDFERQPRTRRSIVTRIVASSDSFQRRVAPMGGRFARAVSEVAWFDARNRLWSNPAPRMVGGTSTLNVSVAGVVSVFSAGSVAATANRWTPSESAGVVNVAPQGLKVPLSSWHVNVEPASLESYRNVAIGTWTVLLG